MGVSQSWLWSHQEPSLVEEAEEAKEDGFPLPELPCVLTSTELMPKRATAGSVGFDVYASEDHTISPLSLPTPVRTGVRLDMSAPDVRMRAGPDAIVYGQLQGRSGLAAKGVRVHPGVIDADFTGEITVLVSNDTDEDFKITKGDRIAQLLFQVALIPRLVSVFEFTPNAHNERDTRGFGSTGR